jgi:regulatory protein
MRKSGHSRYTIKAKLRAKGVDSAILDALEEDEAAEKEAAWIYARKRNLGPYRPPHDRELLKQKDLAAFARRGYSFEIASQILDSDSVS